VITLLTGENSFEIARTLDEIVRNFDGAPEKIDGSELELDRLPDLIMGGTLFATERLVIIRDLSENKKIWEVLPEWLDRVSDDVHLALVEPKPDKRAKTYKALQKTATVKSFEPWSERDMFMAEKWAQEEARRLGFDLDKKCARLLVERVGVNQWLLYHALEKLAVLDTVTPEIIESVIDANPSEKVFNLLDAALRGDTEKVHSMVQILERSEDPYKTFGLLAGQVFQLAVLAAANKRPAEVATDIGVHPYALGKLVPHAERIGKVGVKKIAKIFADTDVSMKSVSVDPWLQIEKALMKTASI